MELIDDPVASFRIEEQALASGKAVTSANKKMIAENISTESLPTTSVVINDLAALLLSGFRYPRRSPRLLKKSA